MSGLVTAFALFIALHSIPATPTVKSRIVRTVGRRTYLALYSLVSTALLVWLFYEALNTEYVELWLPAAWQAYVTIATAPIGLFLVVTGLLSPNPFSVTLRRETDVAGAVLGITRHPVLWGFLIWSAGHMFPNGDLRSVILFGGFAAFSLGGIVMTERRSRKKLGPTWERAVRGTSVIPFLAAITTRSFPRIDLPMIAGAIVTLALAGWLLHGGHAALFGVDPIETLRALG